MSQQRDVLLCVMQRVGAAFASLIVVSWILRRIWAVAEATALLLEATIERIMRYFQ